MAELVTPDAEDQKLITLARAARGRIGASTGAAVRDETGRSYTGADVTVGQLHLTGLQLAVAVAVASGARGLEGAAVVGGSDVDLAAVREVGGTGVLVWLADGGGNITGRVST